MNEPRKSRRSAADARPLGSNPRRAAQRHKREARETAEIQHDPLWDAVDPDDEEPLPEPGDFWLELEDEE